MKIFLQIQRRFNRVAHRSALWSAMIVMPFFAGTVFGQESASGSIKNQDKKEAIPMLTSTSGQPGWLSDLSLGIRESYDSNVFLAGADQKYMPAGTRTLKDMSSWVTTFSPRIGINFAPLMGDQKIIQALTIAYQPDFAIYSSQTSETNEAHRFTTALKGKAGDFSFNLENGFAFIDGSREAPAYPGNYLSAYSLAAPRERRMQEQDRAKIVLEYDYGKWFVRPVATLLFYNMETYLKNPALASTPSGYMNYEDRYDVNGGVDLGYKVLPELAATLGYRYGYQYQQTFSWSPCSSSNDYQRLLFGVDGKLWKWLKIQFQLGPDFRSYEGDTSTHISPVRNLNPAVFYGEANVTAEVTGKDRLAFLFKQWRWVSSVGKVPYQDSLYDLTYTRKLSGPLSLVVGGRALESDYTCATGASGMRDDWMVTLSTGLRYAFNTRVSADLAYSANWGVNGYENLPPSQQPASKREFFQSLVSIGAQVKY